MANKKKNNGGRPSKYNQKNVKLALKMSKEGATDKQIAKAIGITEQTLNNWKNKHPEFFESLKKNKSISDDVVVASLYMRATGFTGPDGRYYPPDPTSMIFWLKNRQPDQFSDRKDHNLSGDMNIKFGWEK